MNQAERKKQLKERKKIIRRLTAFGIIAIVMAGGFSTEIGQKTQIEEDSKIWSETISFTEYSDETEADETVLISTPYLSQADKYPTGCECVSAAMVLQFWGYSYTVDELIEQFLPMSDLKAKRNGQLTGLSPEEAFIGNPYLEDSYGCYAPVICQMLEQAVDSQNEVRNLTGMGMEELCREYLDEGIPVLCWVTINMEEPGEGTSWRLEGEDEWFTWIAKEHCMVLVGYDNNDYYFNDPYDGNGLVHWEKSLTQMRYEQLGCQAVALI